MGKFAVAFLLLAAFLLGGCRVSITSRRLQWANLE